MGVQHGSMPDPDQAKDLAEFTVLLGELRAWAGMPSYRILARRAGQLMRPTRSLPPTTVVNPFSPGPGPRREHAVATASTAKLHDTAWQAGRLLRRIYSERGRLADAARISAAVVEAARKAGNRSAEGRALYDLGWARTDLERLRPYPNLEDAAACMRRAVDLCDRAGDGHGKGCALNGLARILGYQNRHAEALDCYKEALTISREE